MTASLVWSVPPANLILNHDAVHVWRASLDPAPERTDALADLLAPDERDRAARCRFSRDRRQFIAGRGQLRLVLSRYLGCAPDVIAFSYGPQGKPEVESLSFNVSHAGGIALYAVSRSRRVGVDVERLRDVSYADEVVERFFSACEAAAYRTLAREARAEAFATCWTRKEAFIKAVGTGLSYPLSAFDVTVRPDEPARLLAVRGREGPARRWQMEILPVGSGYTATVAADRPPWRLLCLDASSLRVRSAGATVGCTSRTAYSS